MAALNSVACPAGQWTEISTSMSSLSGYVLESNGNSNFFLTESAASPVDGQSILSVSGGDRIQVQYDGVASFWVQPESSTMQIDIQILEAV